MVLPEKSYTPQRAVLAANMETALNAVLGRGAGPADRIAIVGAGVRRFLGCVCVRADSRCGGHGSSTSTRHVRN